MCRCKDEEDELNNAPLCFCREERFKLVICWILVQREGNRANQRYGSSPTLSHGSFWAAACLCIRLWFTSALCDDQNIQLTLTVADGSGYIEQLHLWIYLSLSLLPGSSLSSLFFSVSGLHLKLWWCGNKPVFTTLHLSIPVIPVLHYLSLAVFILLQLGPLHPPPVLYFLFLVC